MRCLNNDRRNNGDYAVPRVRPFYPRENARRLSRVCDYAEKHYHYSCAFCPCIFAASREMRPDKIGRAPFGDSRRRSLSSCDLSWIPPLLRRSPMRSGAIGRHEYGAKARSGSTRRMEIRAKLRVYPSAETPSAGRWLRVAILYVKPSASSLSCPLLDPRPTARPGPTATKGRLRRPAARVPTRCLLINLDGWARSTISPRQNRLEAGRR